jgi:hypothetical protein
MTEQELLPCPICGCDAEVSGESEYTEIDCGNGRCECFGECFDRETWNDRANKYGDSVEADHGEMARKALEGK